MKKLVSSFFLIFFGFSSTLHAATTVCGSSKGGKAIKFFADYEVVEGTAFGEVTFEAVGLPMLFEDFNSDELPVKSNARRLDLGEGYSADFVLIEDALKVEIVQKGKILLTCQ